MADEKSASQEFKAQLRQDELTASSIGRALTTALTELIELKITTWVVPAEEGAVTSEPMPGYRMQTKINIVDGDIDNEVGSIFLDNPPYGELREFHLSQVRESRQILQDNLSNLQKLFGILISTVTQLPHSSQPSNRSLPGDRAV